VAGSGAGQYVKSNYKQGTDDVRSNLHTGQYSGSVSPDHSQGQALVEPLALPDVARHINKFLCKTTQKGAVDLLYTPWSQLLLVESGNCFGGHGI